MGADRAGNESFRVIDGDMRRDVAAAQIRDEPGHIEALGVAQSDARLARSIMIDQDERRFPFGRSGGTRYLTLDRQAVPVLHQRVAQVAELAFLAVGLAIAPGVGIGRAGVAGVRTLLAAIVPLFVGRPPPIGHGLAPVG